jgi:hypothetical protein
MHSLLRVAMLSSGAFLALACGASAKEEKVELKDVPRPVIEAATKRFPEAKLNGAGKEEGDDGQLVYEVQLTDKSQKVDMTVSPDGTIREIEKQINEADLPQQVRRVLADKYAKSKLKLAEVVILVKDGKEVLDCYEVKLDADRKTTEVKIAADGAIKHVEVEASDEE